MSDWISVDERMPELEADNCCMDEEDYGRFSEPVLVFDESYGRSLVAAYDGRKDKWNSDAGDVLRDITHWQPLPSPPTQETERTM